jgi:hypothetical protein
MGTDRGITDAVTQALRHTPLTGEDIDAIVGIAQGLVDKGWQPKRCFPKGLPAVDGAVLEYEVPATAVPEFVELMTLEQRIEEIRLHGVGMPVNDGMLVRVAIR